MKISTTILALTALAISTNTYAADLAKGKTLSQPCLECHEVLDFEGEPVAELETSLKGFVAGTKKHKTKVTLTDEEIVHVAAYFASGGQK